MRTQRMDYGVADVKRFINDVLPSAGNTPVQIAHAGGWGGIDPATLSALGAFADAIQTNPERFRHVWTDKVLPRQRAISGRAVGRIGSTAMKAENRFGYFWESAAVQLFAACIRSAARGCCGCIIGLSAK
jgi:hypothetical protein